MQAPPSHYLPQLQMLMAATQRAEASGDFAKAIAIADEILRQSDIDSFPEFAATVRLERGYLQVSSGALSTEGAHSLVNDVAVVDSALKSPPAELVAVRSITEGAALLVLASQGASYQQVMSAHDLLGLAGRTSGSGRLVALARLLDTRALSRALAIQRSVGTHDTTVTGQHCRQALDALMLPEQAQQYLRSSAAASAYHEVVAEAALEVYFAEATAKDSISQSTALKYLNMSFTACFAHSQAWRALPPIPFVQGGELAVVLAQVILVGAKLAAEQRGNGAADLRVFLERVGAAFGEGGLTGRLSTLTTTFGLLESHNDLIHAIFSPGGKMSPDELAVVRDSVTKARASAALLADASSMEVPLIGIDATLVGIGGGR